MSEIISSNIDSCTPFMRLMWNEQNKLRSSNPKGLKYHPDLIRFSLSIYSKSPSAYEELRSSGILTLPSQRTLRDYRNAIKPMAGFNPDVIEELLILVKDFKAYQRYVVISFDEVKIQSNLVYDKSSEELIGFVDLGDSTLNMGSFNDLNDIASYCLVFYVRGVASKLKFALGYICTTGAKSHQILATFWDAVSVLELNDIYVVAGTCDGASPNRKFFSLHSLLDGSDDFSQEDALVYRSKNLFSEDKRYIWFFSDAPHLMKTLRNCIYHSSPSSKSRNMLNKDFKITWSHIRKIVEDDMKRPLHLLHKLKPEHCNLTPYSKMNVRLAVQVLSASVANVLTDYYPVETHGTAELLLNMNKFFDCLNTRSYQEHWKKRKDDVKPYTSVEDPRFEWLKNVFVKYFDDWKIYIDTKFKDFTLSDRQKLFISNQTYHGLKITVNSVIECTQFLLKNGVNAVLTEHFNQDILEEYFGEHRSLGRRSENPTVYQFGYQSNAIRISKSVKRVTTGNTSGRHTNKSKHSWYDVSDEPLNKRRSTKTTSNDTDFIIE